MALHGLIEYDFIQNFTDAIFKKYIWDFFNSSKCDFLCHVSLESFEIYYQNIATKVVNFLYEIAF